jgi:hypothetical protein
MNHYSASSISMFMRCQIQFMFRYIMNIKIPPGIALIVGKSVHKGVEEDLSNLINTEKHLPKNEVIEISTEHYNKELSETELDETQKEKDDMKDTTAKQTEHWYDNLSHTYNPIDVEKKIEFYIPEVNIPIIGYIDQVEEDKIRDLKTTTGRMKTQKDAQYSIAGTIYSLSQYLETKIIKDFQIDCIKTKSFGYFQSSRTIQDFNKLIKLVQRIHKLIQQKIFIPPAEDSLNSWICQPKFCGYWHQCEFAKK